MATTIKVGHASISENSTANGQAGDQTGKEVRIDAAYSIVGSFKPSVVLRPKSASLAKKSALACEAGCNNNNIGYSQIYYGGRNSAEVAAKKVDYDLSKITTACNTDCSAFMTLCAVAGGASFSYYNSWGNAPVCSSMRKWFTQNDDYEALTDTQHLTITDYLKRGDILVDEDYHTVMVLENGCQIIETAGIKINVAINSLGTTDISATATVMKVIDGEIKSIAESSDIASYSWSYSAEPLNGTDGAVETKKLSIDSGSAEFVLSNLTPASSYILKVTAKELNSSAEFTSPNILFTTFCKYPTAVRNLKAELKKIDTADAECIIRFQGPDDWGNSDFKKGFRLYLIINGDIAGINDSIISYTSKDVESTILLKDITRKVSIAYGDTLQIGIQPWLKDSLGKILFDKTTLKCSKPIYNKCSVNIVDKIFLKVKEVFKPVVLYINK